MRIWTITELMILSQGQLLALEARCVAAVLLNPKDSPRVTKALATLAIIRPLLLRDPARPGGYTDAPGDAGCGPS